MASSLPVSLRIAQAAGILGATWLSGNIASLSLITVPALNESGTRDSVSASTLSKQWQAMYSRGKAQNPPIATVPAASFSYLAWTMRSLPGNKAVLYGVAAVLTVGVVPWTLLLMNSTNQKLHEKADSPVAEKVDEKEVEDLLKKWGTLNGYRSLLPLVGSAAAIFAVLS